MAGGRLARPGPAHPGRRPPVREAQPLLRRVSLPSALLLRRGGRGDGGRSRLPRAATRLVPGLASIAGRDLRYRPPRDRPHPARAGGRGRLRRHLPRRGRLARRGPSGLALAGAPAPGHAPHPLRPHGALPGRRRRAALPRLLHQAGGGGGRGRVRAAPPALAAASRARAAGRRRGGNRGRHAADGPAHGRLAHVVRVPSPRAPAPPVRHVLGRRRASAAPGRRCWARSSC